MKLKVNEIVIFGILGALMYTSKLVMEAFPNIHLIGVFVISMTVVYRKKALYPIYIYVILCGLFGGFAAWWIPQLYVWTILWGMTMVLPKKLSPKLKPIVYMTVCALHGFLYGLLYAPVHALLYRLNIQGMIAWIAAGIPWDITHGISNFICGILISPLISVLKRCEKR